MNRHFEQLGTVIHNLLRDSGLDKKVNEYQAINLWKEVVGDEISNVTQPLKVTDGKLFIRVSNSSWRNELVMLKPKLLKKLQERIDASIVNDILFM